MSIAYIGQASLVRGQLIGMKALYYPDIRGIIWGDSLPKAEEQKIPFHSASCNTTKEGQ